MIKSSLVKKLLKNNPHLIQKDIEIIVDTVLENIGETLSSNGRNPRTGEAVVVPAKNVPMFKPGKGVRDRLNYKS